MTDGLPVRHAALSARLAVASSHASARDACERLGAGLDPRDRALLLNLVAGTTRHLLTLDHLLSRHARRGLQNLSPAVREALRLGAFQLAFCERIPAHAAVAATVEAVKAIAPKGTSTVNAVLRALASEIVGLGPSSASDDPFQTLPDGAGSACRFSAPVLPEGDPRSPSLLSIRFSLPAWLAGRWVARFGPEGAERLALLSLGPPPLVLRVNPLRGTSEDLAGRLSRAGVRSEALPSGALRLFHAGNVTELPGWDEGSFSVQDETAQRAAEEGVRPKPGERILDLCAGVGGKACALAERKASVTALDLSEKRLGRLRAGASRLGLPIEAHAGNALSPPEAWRQAFDTVLLDAPCTNTGVLRRRPEARWRLSPEDPGRMAALQARLLESAAGCVKPGGRLVYSTCSLEAEENEQVARGFLQAHPRYSPEAEAFTLPTSSADGGYWIRLSYSDQE